MASEAADEQKKLATNPSSVQRPTSIPQIGSSVWNLCSIPSDNHAVDLRDITPSISPAFTEDQVRELSDQTGDLDVLGDSFLHHDTFKRITEVLSPEQTNLLISTCTSLCSESGVMSYSDPVVGSIGHLYTSPHESIMNPPPGNSSGIDPLHVSDNNKSKTDSSSSKHLSNTVVSGSTTVNDSSMTKVELDAKNESEVKLNEDSTKESDSDVQSKDSKTKTVQSSYSLRSSPRKSTKEHDKSMAESPSKSIKQIGKKDPSTDTETERRRRSPRGQKQPSEKEETELTDTKSQGKRGRQKDEQAQSEPEKEGNKAEEGISLRRSSRIQRHDTSPAKSKTQSPRKGRGAKKNVTPEQEEDVTKIEEKQESTSENTQNLEDTQSEKSVTEKEEENQSLTEIKERLDTSNKTIVHTDGKIEDTIVSNAIKEVKQADIGPTATLEAGTNKELLVTQENMVAKDLVPTGVGIVGTNVTPSVERTIHTTLIPTEEGIGGTTLIPTGVGIVGTNVTPSIERTIHTTLIPIGEGIGGTTLIPTGVGIVGTNVTPSIERTIHTTLIRTGEGIGGTTIIPTGVGIGSTSLIPTRDGIASRDLHVLLTGEGIVGSDLIPTGEGIVDRDVKDILIVEKDILEIIEKEINEPRREGMHFIEETLKTVEKKENSLKTVEEGKKLEESKLGITKKKSGGKKDLQPSRRSNRISESIQKREIEAAVKKAQEEMFREREEQERLEREEEEKKRKEEEEKMKLEEELKRKEEPEEKMDEEKEQEESEIEENKTPKKKAVQKKERKQEKSKDENKKSSEDLHKNENENKPSELKSNEKSETIHHKTPDKTSHGKTSRKSSIDKAEEKKSESDGSTLFAVGGDHEVYSKVKHKRLSSESELSREKDRKLSEGNEAKRKDGRDSSSDEEKASDDDQLGEDDSDYDPEYDPERLWCICRKPHGNRFMICCDSCEEWLHGDCVSITKEIGKEMEKNGIEYVCPRCVIAKRRLKEQGIDPNKQADESSSIKRRRRHSRLKIPGEKRHRHSADSTKAFLFRRFDLLNMISKSKSKRERHERKSKDESQKDSSEGKRKHIDTSAFYKIPKKVRTTPTPASFSSRTQRTCINSDCHNHAETNSVYCSDECVAEHAQESISLLHDERKKRIGSSSTHKSSPSSGIDVPMPWESPHSAAPSSPQVKERVAVIERSTGRVIAGVAAPAEQDLIHWLQRHPTFEVIKPSVSKEVKKKDRREEERAIRENVKRSLKDILSSRLREAPELQISFDDISKFSINIEEDLYKLFGDAGPRYKSKYRSLAFNLKDFRNKVLFYHVLSGEVPTDKLVGMTAEQLASQELARWRERETKHSLEMIKLNQLDINASKGHIKKTHKGEIELDEDEDLSNLEVKWGLIDLVSTIDLFTDAAAILNYGEIMGCPGCKLVHPSTKEKSEVAEPDSNTSPGPLLIDTTDQHRIHLFDLNCRICTGKMQPPGEPPRQEDMLMLVSTTTPIQALAESSVPSPPPLNMDIQSVSSTESFDVGSVSPPAPIKPVRRDKPVWKGFVMMQSVCKFSTNAYRVSGPCDDLLQLLPDTLHLQGRIGFSQVWDYIHQLRHSTTRDVSVIRYEASSDEEKASYVSLYSYFYSRKRCGVVSNCYTGVKDMYLMPLASHSPVPSELLPFDGPGLEEPRPHMLLAIVVRTKAHFKRPHPVHHRSTSPTAKRRHGSSRKSEESQPKDSPPHEIEDIVFQFAHNKKASLEIKPSLSPTSGSSDHSSSISSPPATAPVANSTETAGDKKVITQKSQKEELQDLTDRAKQYIASALQAKKQADQTGANTKEDDKHNESDKPYDPEEGFDLDLELEKPIDANKKKALTQPTTKAPMKSSDVSSTEGLSSAVDRKDSEKAKTFKTVGGATSEVGSIPLLDNVSSSVPPTSAVQSLPLSLFMPINTSTVTTSSSSSVPPMTTQTAQLPIPSSDLAGIVKLLGASLKQVNTASLSPIQGQLAGDSHRATATSAVPTTATRDTRQDHRREAPDPEPVRRPSADHKPDQSIKSGRPMETEHRGANTSESDRQRIDRERLEWRERRFSRDGPRAPGVAKDNVPHDDRWRDQRDDRGPPMRRVSDERYHGEYGPHRGSHSERGRYQPYHREDHRGDRSRRDDPRWRERWRR
ncbi:hypothetical protein QZH41_017331 [Actinostola sp. cb2023]|nr:hypothetical protein QZH41_017331 [Actinostola sp. cb2023]